MKVIALYIIAEADMGQDLTVGCRFSETLRVAWMDLGIHVGAPKSGVERCGGAGIKGDSV